MLSCLSCFWPNRNAASQVGSDTLASAHAHTEDVASSVQDAYHASQTRPPEGGDRAPPPSLATRVISPLPSTEELTSDDRESPVSWILQGEDDDSHPPEEMGMSQTPPTSPSTPVTAMGLNSVDSRKDSDLQFEPKGSLDDVNHDSGEKSMNVVPGWSFSSRSQEDSSQLQGQEEQVQWNPFSSMGIAPLFPTATPVINGRGQDSDREDSDSFFNPKEVSVSKRVESLVQGGQPRSMEVDSPRDSTPLVSRTSTPVKNSWMYAMDAQEDAPFDPKDEGEEDSPLPQKTPMPFSPRLGPSSDVPMTSFPSLSQSPDSCGAKRISTVWRIRPEMEPYQTSYKPYYSSEDEEG